MTCYSELTLIDAATEIITVFCLPHSVARKIAVICITYRCAFTLRTLQRLRRQRARMSTIDEVRAAETKLRELVKALRKFDAHDESDLSIELRTASDEYARAIRELELRRPLSA